MAMTRRIKEEHWNTMMMMMMTLFGNKVKEKLCFVLL